MQNQPAEYLSPTVPDYVLAAAYDDFDGLYPDLDYEFDAPDEPGSEIAPVIHGDDEGEYDRETGRWYAVSVGPADDEPGTIAEIVNVERQANADSHGMTAATASTRRALDAAQMSINARLDAQFATSTAEELDDAGEAWLR